MIQKKKKTCKNCKTEQFIWKAGLCKSCSSILNPPKKISYKSAKQKIKDVEKREYANKQFNLFYNIWAKKRHYCESCGLWLGNEPKSVFFDHLLEKSKYPEFALLEENIYICCLDCHSKKTNGFPTENHKKAIDNIKNNFL
jgi:5-methylcytosine-specific restriction endonuclease McrA